MTVTRWMGLSGVLKGSRCFRLADARPLGIPSRRMGMGKVFQLEIEHEATFITSAEARSS